LLQSNIALTIYAIAFLSVFGPRLWVMARGRK
jgi:hypothetical protein